VDIEGLSFGFCEETLAENNLENIAGTDVLLGFADNSGIFGATEVRLDLHFAVASNGLLPGQLGRRRLLEKLAGAANFLHRGVVARAQSAARAARIYVVNDPEAMLHVIESDKPLIKHQLSVVEADLIAKAPRQALDQPHHVVREVAD